MMVCACARNEVFLGVLVSLLFASAASNIGRRHIQRHETPSYISEHIQNMHLPNYTGLAIAVDSISIPLLKKMIRDACINVSSTATGYDDPIGNLDFRTAAANLLSRSTKRMVFPEWISAGAGVSAVSETLFSIISERGDGCLIPAPYFPGFDYNLKTRIGVEPIPVWGENDFLGDLDSVISPMNLESALQKNKHLNITTLLLTNPHNPTGIVYSKNALRDAISWACGWLSFGLNSF